jgi:hypothetical protein
MRESLHRTDAGFLCLRLWGVSLKFFGAEDDVQENDEVILTGG